LIEVEVGLVGYVQKVRLIFNGMGNRCLLPMSTPKGNIWAVQNGLPRAFLASCPKIALRSVNRIVGNVFAVGANYNDGGAKICFVDFSFYRQALW
jgi:hypothetical protein